MEEMKLRGILETLGIEEININLFILAISELESLKDDVKETEKSIGEKEEEINSKLEEFEKLEGISPIDISYIRGLTNLDNH